MYYLLEFRHNYFMTTGSLWNLYREKVNDDAKEIAANRRLINSEATTIKSFEYKANITGRTPANNNTLDTENVAPLKYFSNFGISLDLLLL